MHDSVELENRGVPTVTIVTDAFEGSARSQAISLGMPWLPLVITAHPFVSLPLDKIRERAEAMVDEIVSGLTEQPNHEI